ncbi:MAG: ribonuclease R [Elusimicrobiota bacterium]
MSRKINKSHRKFFTEKKNKTHSESPKLKPNEKVFVEGALQLKGKFGFVLSEDPKIGDVLIQGNSLKLAMNGDRVKAHVIGIDHDNRRSGVITAVIKRARDKAVGTFKRLGNMAVVALDNEQMVRLLDLKKFSPKVGDIVVAKITRWPTGRDIPAGELVEIIGAKDSPGVDLKEVIQRYDLSNEFPEPVEKEAEYFGTEVRETDYLQPTRELFFDNRVFTIDGADAKDFDDAVSLEPIENGWQLGVHIADVSHYVKEGSDLDKEAESRGTSVYLTGNVLPMLPFSLSDGLCSLRPDCVRLTLSCLMDIGHDGEVKNHRIVESAIRSSKRFTYEEVEEILKGANPLDLDPRIISDVREMGKVAALLRKKRFGRGSLDFDFPEPYVITGLDGKPLDIRRRSRLEAHRLIEDFMLLANETVAKHMKGHPFVYRIHETPDPARVEKLFKSLETLGLPISNNRDISRPSALQSILSAAEKSPYQTMVHMMILRSLKQAIYSPHDKGHYGLASESYTHFTSPIRRYPDLIVHRLLKERMKSIQRTSHWIEKLPSLCENTSKRERIAVEAEREFLDVQKVRFMEPHVGETFAGTISSVTNFGFFVELEAYFVEGLVHITNLGNDYFIYDEARMILTGRRTGKIFSMGQKVKVQLAAANIVKRQLDFQLKHSESSHKEKSHSGSFRKFEKKRRR